MKNLMKRLIQYINESFSSILISRIISIILGLFTIGICEHNLSIIDNENIPISVKFLILGIIFVFFYILSTLIYLRPHRYKFRMKSVDITVEYLGDTVKVYSTYRFSTNRFRTNCMYTNKTWFFDETFLIKSNTPGYTLKHLRSLGQTHEYYIVFPRYQYFWETKTVEIEFEGKNSKRKFENFYWYDVVCPIKHLTIDVHMARDYCTPKIELKSFFLHEHSTKNAECIENYDGAYKWKIDYPKLKYFINMNGIGPQMN